MVFQDLSRSSDKMDKVIYHFSEEPDISYFEPWFSTPELGAVVWGVSEVAMYKYLLPRDCPRVTFCADDQTSARDVQSFFGHSSVRCVVAIESCWLETVRRVKLYRYHLPSDTFKLAFEDERTQYYISDQLGSSQNRWGLRIRHGKILIIVWVIEKEKIHPPT